MSSWLRVLGWAGGVLGAAVVVALQVSPETATSNIAGWVKFLGFPQAASDLPPGNRYRGYDFRRDAGVSSSLRQPLAVEAEKRPRKKTTLPPQESIARRQQEEIIFNYTPIHRESENPLAQGRFLDSA